MVLSFSILCYNAIGNNINHIAALIHYQRIKIPDLSNIGVIQLAVFDIIIKVFNSGNDYIHNQTF